MRSEPETRYVKSGDAHIAYENSYCGVFATSDGKITAVREYLDTQRMGAVLFGR